MGPPYLGSIAQAGGDDAMAVWGMFSWHILDPFIPIDHCLNAIANKSIAADHVPPLMATNCPASDSYFLHENATMSQGKRHLKLVQCLRCSLLAFLITESESNKTHDIPTEIA